MWPSLDRARVLSKERTYGSSNKRKFDAKDDEDLYAIERVLDKRIDRQTGLVEYLVQWAQWDSRFNSWETPSTVGHRLIVMYETGLRDPVLQFKKLNGPELVHDTVQIRSRELPTIVRRTSFTNSNDFAVMHISQSKGFCTIDAQWTVRSVDVRDKTSLLRYCVVIDPNLDGFVPLADRALRQHDVVLMPSHAFLVDSFRAKTMSSIPSALVRVWKAHVEAQKTGSPPPPTECIAFAVRFPTRAQLMNQQGQSAGVSFDRLQSLSIGASSSASAPTTGYTCQRCGKHFAYRGWYIKHIKQCTA